MLKKFQLNPGNGPKKPFKKMVLNPLQKQVYDYVYDDVNGALNFASNCCWVNCNGLVQYQPYEYQRHLFWNYTNYDRNISLIGRQQGKCLKNNTFLKIRNKHTGKIEEITIEQLFNRCKK